MSNKSLADIDARDLIVLQARVRNPNTSYENISKIIEEKFDISLSHNYVNTLLREMEAEGIFKRSIKLRRSLFEHYVFRIAFHYPGFNDHWEACYETLVEDPHVLIFFDADDEYRWQLVTRFWCTEQMDEWVTEFFEDHGDVINEFEIISIHNIHKFEINAEIFNDPISETEDGREYLERRDKCDGDRDCCTSS